MFQKFCTVAFILVAHRTEMFLHFSQFEYSTQPRKNEGRRMSALTKIPLYRKKWWGFFAYEFKKEYYVAHISFTPQEAEIGR